MSRRDARETAFHLLFQLSFQTGKRRPQEEFFWELIASGRHAICEQEGFQLSEDDLAYAKALAEGVYPMASQLDKRFASYLKGWEVRRLPNIDRQILRLAVYELQERDDIPIAVAVNEAVLLARKYSTETSRSYINAVLGRMARELATDDDPAVAYPLMEEFQIISTYVFASDVPIGVSIEEVSSSAASVETAMSYPYPSPGKQTSLAAGEQFRERIVKGATSYDRPGMSL